jgi:molecular chaperone GrpE
MSQTMTEDAADAPQPAAVPQEDPFEGGPLAAAQAETEKWKDTALRTAAELDNYRKRIARDMQDARAYANADLLRALLPVMDNFEMGLEAARAENEKGLIFQGLSMVRRQLSDFLRDTGVEEINPAGQKFDPNLHEAVSQEPSQEHAEGVVLKVARRGFKLKDRLLRAAMVVVSSGAPKARAGAGSAA